MAEDINYIDIEEWAEIGYLQEVNRLVLHPAGLAIARRGPWTDEDVLNWFSESVPDFDRDKITFEQVMAFVAAVDLDRWHLSGVWDYRDDPEGITFRTVDADKVAAVRAEHQRHRDARLALFKREVREPQPPDSERTQCVVQNPGETG